MGKTVMVLVLPEPKIRKATARAERPHRDKTRYTRKVKHKAPEWGLFMNVTCCKIPFCLRKRCPNVAKGALNRCQNLCLKRPLPLHAGRGPFFAHPPGSFGHGPCGSIRPTRNPAAAGDGVRFGGLSRTALICGGGYGCGWRPSFSYSQTPAIHTAGVWPYRLLPCSHGPLRARG